MTRDAATALRMLRERPGDFDLVISDVHMLDMDGFKLLELIGLEMDLPVISKTPSFTPTFHFSCMSWLPFLGICPFSLGSRCLKK